MKDRLRLIGTPASPYTRKLLSVARFRHIPHAPIWSEPEDGVAALGLAEPKPLLLPVCVMPNSDTAICDTTPIIRQLEEKYTQRSVIPDDPVLAFVDYLIEDYADEWVTKPMFHFRWHYAADTDLAGSVLPLMLHPTIDDAEWQQRKETFASRQIGRLGYVGSNDGTDAMIDASFRRMLSILDAIFVEQPFLLGDRPSASDFGLFGQLTQLTAFDPTPTAIAREISPRTVAWVSVIDDLSGLSIDGCNWLSREAARDKLHALLSEIGRTYVPALLVNAEALAKGEKEWQTEIDGQLWKQGTFTYQGKCLRWLRELREEMSDSDRQALDALLDGTGCEQLFADAGA